MKINILGSVWTIEERCEANDPRLEGCDGYTDWTIRLIAVEREMQGNLSNMEAYIRKVKRHEIVHAYILESGLDECSCPVDAWGQNEEMIDWIARMGPKIYNTWVEADAILPEDYNPDEKKRLPTWFEKAYKENRDKAIQKLVEEVRSSVERQAKDCPFCGDHARAMVTWRGAPAELRRIEPLPVLNLTTGEKDDSADPPYMAIAIDGEDGEDYLAIEFCPFCGKNLNPTKR